MENFEYVSPTRLIFGRDSENTVGKEVKKYADKILLHYGGSSIKKSGLYERIISSLKAENISVIELSGAQPNPRLPLVYEGIKICKENNIQFILAVGGGSAIDSAKAIGMGAVYDGDVWDFYDGTAVAENTLPIATVLTIPAAGSESSPSSVITNEEKGHKNGCTNEITRPVFSIMNPTLCYTLPPYQMSCGVSDIIAHLMERYFTQTKNVDFSDRLLEGSLKSVMYSARKLAEDYENYDLWANIMWAGCVGHNGILGMGREEDWASHGIEHELSALYDIAHGAGLAIVFPAWMRHVCSANKKRFVQFAIRVMEVDLAMEDEDQIIKEGIERLENFYFSIGLPVRMTDLEINDEGEETGIQITEADISHMAKNTVRYGAIGNFVRLKENDIDAILHLAL